MKRGSKCTEEASSEIKKAYVTTSKKKKPPVDVIPTGADLLDLVLMGGYPVGRIINIVGDSSTGKSYLASEFIATCRIKTKKKIKHFYDDVETGYSFDTMAMYGFAMMKKDQETSETVEGFALNLQEELEDLKADELLVYILDSLDGVSSLAERQRDKKMMKDIKKGNKIDGTYSLEKQKFFSSFFRLRSKEISDKNCILLILSQVRDNINAGIFAKKHKRTGGKALDFYAHSCLWLAVVQKIVRKKRPIGITVKVKAEKAKIPRPFRECYIDIIFDYGIDNITSNLKYLYDLRTDIGKDKAGLYAATLKDITDEDEEAGTKKKKVKIKKLDWDGEEYTLQQLIMHIEENNLEDELKNRITEKWEDIENSIASNRKNKWQNQK